MKTIYTETDSDDESFTLYATTSLHTPALELRSGRSSILMYADNFRRIAQAGLKHLGEAPAADLNLVPDSENASYERGEETRRSARFGVTVVIREADGAVTIREGNETIDLEPLRQRQAELEKQLLDTRRAIAYLESLDD